MTAFVPYVTSARRYLFLAEREATRLGDDGPAMGLYARRIEATGTPLTRFRRIPGRTALLAAGVLCVEEVIGASVDELLSYGVPRAVAPTLLTALERIAAEMTTFAADPVNARSGHTYDQDLLTLMASAARTASANSDVYEIGDRGTLRLDLAVTVFTGTSLHVQIETRKSSSDDWRVVDAFVLVTATGTQRRTMGGLDRYVRARCTFVGTTATYSLGGEAVG